MINVKLLKWWFDEVNYYYLKKEGVKMACKTGGRKK